MDYKLPKGESIRDTQQRALTALNEILIQNQSKILLIGTHGTFLSALINHYDSTFKYNEWAQMKMPEVYKFVYSGLVFMNFNRIELG